MSQIELEQELQSEGLWVSGIIRKFRTKKTNYSSPTKTALFYALYQGPVKSQLIQSQKSQLIKSTK